MSNQCKRGLHRLSLITLILSLMGFGLTAGALEGQNEHYKQANPIEADAFSLVESAVGIDISKCRGNGKKCPPGRRDGERARPRPPRDRDRTRPKPPPRVRPKPPKPPKARPKPPKPRKPPKARPKPPKPPKVRPKPPKPRKPPKARPKPPKPPKVRPKPPRPRPPRKRDDDWRRPRPRPVPPRPRPPRRDDDDWRRPRPRPVPPRPRPVPRPPHDDDWRRPAPRPTPPPSRPDRVSRCDWDHQADTCSLIRFRYERPHNSFNLRWSGGVSTNRVTQVVLENLYNERSGKHAVAGIRELIVTYGNGQTQNLVLEGKDRYPRNISNNGTLYLPKNGVMSLPLWRNRRVTNIYIKADSWIASGVDAYIAVMLD